MNGWRRYLELQARSRTGLSGGVIAAAVVGMLAAMVTLGLAVTSLFIWLAQAYSPLTAGLILTAAFLLITLIALVCCVLLQRRNAEQAKIALAARSNQPWLDPRTMAMGLQIGRAIGWRKIVPLVAAGLLAAEIARHVMGRRRPASDESDADDERDEADEAA